MDTERKDIPLKGKPRQHMSVNIDGKEIQISGHFIKTARLAEEWYQDAEAPDLITESLRESKLKVDIFSFWQRLPDTKPHYHYCQEWESIAALPIKSYDYWWKNQVNPKTRNLVRKAEKMGVVVKECSFNEEFIKGMTDIFNETPIRQGKPFWHYGKDFETIKRQFARYLFREELFGAYYNGDLIGFIFMAYTGKYAMLGQIISKIEHRDKAPNNALISKAVEICDKKGIPYLVYAMWSTAGLGDFKRHNGFERFDLPRYYVPLTIKGKIILKLRLHHGILGIIPERLKGRLIDLRKKWYSKKLTVNTMDT